MLPNPVRGSDSEGLRVFDVRSTKRKNGRRARVFVCGEERVGAHRADARSVVETRNDTIKECYDAALEADEKAAGTVVVNFIVEKKTGTIMNPSVDESSTAPEGLSQCIVKGLEGLSLEPEDQREGQASFTWNFEVGEPKSAS